MRSCPIEATLHDFLCGVAPVGQLGMEGISAFYTGTRPSQGGNPGEIIKVPKDNRGNHNSFVPGYIPLLLGNAF